MNMHKNARLTPRGRERIVRQVGSGQTLQAVAEAVGVCLRTARKWVDRYKLAAQHRVPAVYPHRFYVTSGGLICYGPDPLNQLWRAAG
jgi:transposase-like protein